MNKHHVIYGIIGVMFAYDLKVNIKNRNMAVALYNENVELRDQLSKKDKELRYMAEELRKAGVNLSSTAAVR